MRIGFDTFLMSSTAIFIWFLLGIFIDYRFINVFTITYPLQFLASVLKSIFGTSQNIYSKKFNKSIQDEGIMTGILIGSVVFSVVYFNIDNYISFMNMDFEIYHYFVLLSIVTIFFQFICSLILEKLYFDNRNEEANKYNLIFNLIEIVSIVGTAWVMRDVFLTITVSFTSLFLYIIYLFYKEVKIYRINLLLLLNLRYDSVTLVQYLFFLFIYLLGVGHINFYGEEYALAMSFSILVTDAQWDIVDAIKTTTIIQISNKKWNYKKHLKDSYFFTFLLLISVIILILILYPIYQPDLSLFLIYLISDFVAFLLYPMYTIKKYFIQLKSSAKISTSFNIFNNVVRFGCVQINTPFCTTIGHMISSFIQFVGYNYLYKYLKIEENT